MVDASGFYGAPVTKALCGLTLAGFSVLSYTDQKKRHMNALSFNHILESRQHVDDPVCVRILRRSDMWPDAAVHVSSARAKDGVD